MPTLSPTTSNNLIWRVLFYMKETGLTQISMATNIPLESLKQAKEGKGEVFTETERLTLYRWLFGEKTPTEVTHMLDQNGY